MFIFPMDYIHFILYWVCLISTFSAPVFQPTSFHPKPPSTAEDSVFLWLVFSWLELSLLSSVTENHNKEYIWVYKLNFWTKSLSNGKYVYRQSPYALLGRLIQKAGTNATKLLFQTGPMRKQSKRLFWLSGLSCKFQKSNKAFEPTRWKLKRYLFTPSANVHAEEASWKPAVWQSVSLVFLCTNLAPE